jgi:hypothetical protein
MYRARRWGDDDKSFGPFTYSYSNTYRPLAISLKSQGDEDEGKFSTLRLTVLGHTFIVVLPQIVPPYRTKVTPEWDAETIARLGRDWYWDVDEREYSVSYSDGYLSLHFGRQTHDSRTCKQKGWFLPWTQWRHVRHSYYDPAGNHFADIPKRVGQWTRESMDYDRALKDSVPKRAFSFYDFDGELLFATTHIDEMEWHFGEGWFKWLSLFRKPKIRRTLDIWFSGETGKRKGSWKGGTMGHGIEMLPDELHDDAFKRYCTEHDMIFCVEVQHPIDVPTRH